MTDRIFCSVVLIVAAMALPMRAADEPFTPIAPLPLGSLLLNVPSNHVLAPHAFELRFAHRFNGSIDEGSMSDRLHSLFGLDNGANVTMGLSWSPARDVELSLMRSNVLDDVEVAMKYVVMQEARAIPLSLAMRAGVDWRTESGLRGRSSMFAQAIVSRRIGRRMELFAAPVVVTNAGRIASAGTTSALFDRAFALPVGVAFLARTNSTLIVEWTPANRDLPDAQRGDGSWAIGLKQAVGGHHFEVMLTNSLATTVDQSAATSWLGSPLREGDIHIGFNIERQFGRSRGRSR